MASTDDHMARPVEAESGSDIEEKPVSLSPLTEAEVARKNASGPSQPERLKSTPPQSEVGADTEVIMKQTTEDEGIKDVPPIEKIGKDTESSADGYEEPTRAQSASDPPEEIPYSQ